MGTETLAAALEHEHREIDHGIEVYLAGLAEGKSETESLTGAVEALRRHIYLEEEFLFPPLRKGPLMAPIFVMLREHGEMWQTLATLEEELGKDPSSTAVSDTCHRLLDQTDQHNSKEEPTIYPQADTLLSAPASAELRTFLESGKMPDGWVCAKARA